MDLSTSNNSLRAGPAARKYKSWEALAALRQLYASTPYPNRFELGILARNNNLDVSSVRAWFQSRRQNDWRKGKICRTCRHFLQPGISEELHKSNPYSRPCLQFANLMAAAPRPIHHARVLQAVPLVGNNHYIASGSFHPTCNEPVINQSIPAFPMQKENLNQNTWLPVGFGFGNGQQSQWMQGYQLPMVSNNNNFLAMTQQQTVSNENGWQQFNSQLHLNGNFVAAPQLLSLPANTCPWPANNFVPQVQQDGDDNYSQEVKCDPYDLMSQFTSSDEEELDGIC